MQYFTEFEENDRTILSTFVVDNEQYVREFLTITGSIYGYDYLDIDFDIDHIRSNSNFDLLVLDQMMIKQCLIIANKHTRLHLSKVNKPNCLTKPTIEQINKDPNDVNIQQTNTRKRNYPEDEVENQTINAPNVDETSINKNSSNDEISKQSISQIDYSLTINNNTLCIDNQRNIIHPEQKLEPADPSMYWGKLVVLSPPSLVGNKRVSLLPCNGQFRMGSASTSNFVINDRKVSQLLLKLVLDKEDAYLEIHGDSHQVFINTKELKKSHKMTVKSGDHLLVNVDQNPVAFVIMKNDVLGSFHLPKDLNFNINIAEYALRDIDGFQSNLCLNHSSVITSKTESIQQPNVIENFQTQLSNIIIANNSLENKKHGLLKLARNIILKGEVDTQCLREELIKSVTPANTLLYSFDLTKFDNIPLGKTGDVSLELPKLVVGDYVKIKQVARGSNAEVVGKIGIVAMQFHDNTNTNMVGIIVNEILENGFLLSSGDNQLANMSLFFCNCKYLHVIKNEEDLSNDINVLFIRLEHFFATVQQSAVIYLKHIEVIDNNYPICKCLEAISEFTERNIVLVGDINITLDKQENKNNDDLLGFLSGPIVTKEQKNNVSIMVELPKRRRGNSILMSGQREDIFTYDLELTEPSLVIEKSTFRKYVNTFNKHLLRVETHEQFSKNLTEYSNDFNITLRYDNQIDSCKLFGGNEISDKMYKKIINAAVNRKIAMRKMGFLNSVSELNLDYEDIAYGVELFKYKLSNKFAFKLSELNSFEEALLNNAKSQNENAVLFKNVGGLKNIKSIFLQSVILPFINDKQPDNMLLYGPPGTGKTLISLAVAHCCRVNILTISSSFIYNKWLGDSENFAKAIFTLARKVQPVIVFIDEIDAILTSRDSSTSSCEQNVVGIFLQELDGVLSDNNNISFIFATNYIGKLDPAFLRRMGKHLHYVGLPDMSSRQEILLACIRTHSIPLPSTLLAMQMQSNNVIEQVDLAMRILFEQNVLQSLLSGKINIQELVDNKFSDREKVAFSKRQKLNIDKEKSKLSDVLNSIINNKDVMHQIELDMNILSEVAKKTEYFSGSDIDTLCFEVEKKLTNELLIPNKKQNELTWRDYRNCVITSEKLVLRRAVSMDDFNFAMEKVTPSVENEDKYMDQHSSNHSSDVYRSIYV